MEIAKKLFITLIVLGVLAVGATTCYIVFAAIGLLDKSVGLSIIFAVITPLFYIALSLVFANYYTLLGVIRKLHQENMYYLGKDTGFYNYYLFSRRVKKLFAFTKKGKESYIISCTPMKLNVVRNNVKNEVISDYVCRLADEIELKYRLNNKEIYTSLAYCYYHGSFLFYIVGEIEMVKKIADEIEKMMYDIAINNKLNVYIQPYFGIAPLSNVFDNLLIDVENASLARSEAERLYTTLEYYVPTMNKKTDINEIKRLRDALKDEEFLVYYQPKYDLASGEFVSSEALVRWNSSLKGGIVSPAQFIELAEQGGVIHEVDMYVFRRVCEDIKENRKRGRRCLPVSVNFSMQEFYDTDFINSLVEICDECGVSTKYLYIEITERTSQVNIFMTVAIVNQLKLKGFKVLMDDFGTGFSNLQNLLAIPFDAIKLDRSYVKNIDTDPKAYELVKFIVGLCKANNIILVAEGVDNKTQVEMLKKIKCDIIQGFYYSKPLPKEDFNKFLLPNGNPFEKVKKGEAK